MEINYFTITCPRTVNIDQSVSVLCSVSRVVDTRRRPPTRMQCNIYCLFNCPSGPPRSPHTSPPPPYQQLMAGSEKFPMIALKKLTISTLKLSSRLIKGFLFCIREGSSSLPLLFLMCLISHLYPILPCLILQAMTTQRAKSTKMPRQRMRIAKPGVSISVSSSPSCSINSDSNFSSGLSVVVVVVLLVVFRVVTVVLAVVEVEGFSCGGGGGGVG